MTTLQEIERAISQLSPEELATFRAWVVVLSVRQTLGAVSTTEK